MMKRTVFTVFLYLLLIAPGFSADRIPVFTNQDVEKYSNSASQNSNATKNDEIRKSEPMMTRQTGVEEKSSQSQDDAKKREIEGIVTQTWSSMKSRLLSGDIEGALDYFVEPSRNKYRQIFQKMGKETEYITSIVEIKVSSAYGPFIECWATRQEQDGKHAYPITFVKDNSDNIKIAGF